ncbi:hypothetical protein [Nocardia sp. NPDC052566]|uniref:hypothetical protein n=1 Tax=Nocardia sp. NPDC052566 TaxID=3364330 RepID=UPI0037C558E3
MDEQGNAVSVFVVLQISPDDPLRVKDRVLYTVPSRRGRKLARRLFDHACDVLAAESVVLEWSGIATPEGYPMVESSGFSISPDKSQELGAVLDAKLAEKPDDEYLRSLAALRVEYGGQLPYNPCKPDKAEKYGRETLLAAAEKVHAREIEGG